MITLRSKKTATKGYHLYLDYYYKGKRDFEFLGMYTKKNYTVKIPPRLSNVLDREIMQLANQILIKRQYDFFNNGYKLEKKGCTNKCRKRDKFAKNINYGQRTSS